MSRTVAGPGRRPAGAAPRRVRAALALACAFAGAVAPGPAGAEEPRARVLSVELSPPRRYAGDLVVATLAFDPGTVAPAAGRVDFGPPAADARDPAELVDAELRRSERGWTCVLRFRVWEPGALSVPGFSAGGLAFPPFSATVESLLEVVGREVPPPAAQLELPGTRLLVWGSAGGALAAAALASVLLFRVLPRARALVAEWRAGRSRRELEASLAWLSGRGAGTEPAAAHALLAARVRAWLDDAAGLRASSLTARELGAADRGGFPETAWSPLLGLLARGEALRFAGAEPAEDEVGAACARAAGALAAWKEAVRAGLR